MNTKGHFAISSMASEVEGKLKFFFYHCFNRDFQVSSCIHLQHKYYTAKCSSNLAFFP